MVEIAIVVVVVALLVSFADKPKDLFMQFKPMKLTLDAVDSSVLAEQSEDTGLSVRGGFMWLIHQIEWLISNMPEIDNVVFLALSTKKGLASFPAMSDTGQIAEMRLIVKLTTSGMVSGMVPHFTHFLPPVPIAAPNISLYGKTNTDEAAFQGGVEEARVGFTTAPLDAKSYLEIAEVWAW